MEFEQLAKLFLLAHLFLGGIDGSDICLIFLMAFPTGSKTCTMGTETKLDCVGWCTASDVSATCDPELRGDDACMSVCVCECA